MSIEILASKLLMVMGTYSSKLCSFFVSAFLSKMFDVGDLAVLTFGNCMLTTGVIIITFFQNPKI